MKLQAGFTSTKCFDCPLRNDWHWLAGSLSTGSRGACATSQAQSVPGIGPRRQGPVDKSRFSCKAFWQAETHACFALAPSGAFSTCVVHPDNRNTAASNTTIFCMSQLQTPSLNWLLLAGANPSLLFGLWFLCTSFPAKAFHCGIGGYQNNNQSAYYLFSVRFLVLSRVPPVRHGIRVDFNYLLGCFPYGAVCA